MSDKQNEIRKIWNERFNDSRQWMTEVFSRIYNDEDAMTLDVDGTAVSSLLLRRYLMKYRDAELPVAYVYGAATRRSMQGRGYMSRLMEEALKRSFDRGDAAVMLRPSRRSLYGFYSKMGFETVFYIDEMRYTAAHRFSSGDGDYSVDETVCDIAELAKAYRRLTSVRESTILHTEHEFKNILIDNAIDGGLKAVARHVDTGEIAAIAFAVMRDRSMVVRELVAENESAADAALDSLKERAGEVMTIVVAPPRRDGVSVHARGMARIVNVGMILGAMARMDHGIAQRIRIHDDIIAANDRLFIVADGTVRAVEPDGRQVNLDVGIDVFASIVFSEEKMGEVFGLPTARPFMSLMLD